MRNLIEHVLDYTRIIGENVVAKPVDLNNIIQDILFDLKGDIENSCANIQIGQLPVVEGNPIHFRILLQNLVANAIKYRKKDIEPVIRIKSFNKSHRNETSISIKDNGIGIASKHHKKIFGMFKKLHSRDEYPGVGLGLAVCQRIAVKHGGVIDVHSLKGEGAEFVLTLPLKAVAS